MAALAEAQRRIDAWVAAGNPARNLSLTNCGLRDGELPPLPADLQGLFLGGNLYTIIPPLPPTLLRFSCESSDSLVQLPPLPEGLQVLVTDQCRQLTQLPDLPPTLRHLSCLYNTRLTALPALPNSLTYLNCQNVGLPRGPFPPLPPLLQHLNCQQTNISALPPLPDSLTFLNCGQNYIGLPPAGRGLPPLPPNLRTLLCDQNYLHELPPFPNTLEVLNCRNNLLTVLPPLPNGLRELDAGINPLRVLPPLPERLTSIDVNYLHQLEYPFRAWAHGHHLHYGMVGYVSTQQLKELVNGWYGKYSGKAEGRNLMVLQLARPAANVNTPANWYAGPPRATVEAMRIPDVESVIGSFLSGRHGSINEQRRQLQRQRNLIAREEETRPFGGPGVGLRRKRKSRKTRKTRKSRKARK